MDLQKILMLEADGEKFHFLSCLVHGVTSEDSIHCFPTLVKKSIEIIVSIPGDWRVLSLDIFILCLQKFTGGRMFPIHATFQMMKYLVLMDMFAL